MPSKRVRKPQVTCECAAYDFPHRIGSGACTSDDWCESFREIDSSLRSSCNCFSGSECQAATGQESFKSGDCYEQELSSEWLKSKYGNLPKSQDEIYEIEYRKNYE